MALRRVRREIPREIRDHLDQANVNERVLFPGLDGLSRWLTRYYTPMRMPDDDRREPLPGEKTGKAAAPKSRRVTRRVRSRTLP